MRLPVSTTGRWDSCSSWKEQSSLSQPVMDFIWKGRAFGTRGSRTRVGPSTDHSDMERGQEQFPEAPLSYFMQC